MKKILFSLFVCCFVGSVSGAPISYNFFQGGFDEDAEVTGMFTGDDLDGNGQLASFDGEISSFMMEFSGNGLVAAFSLDFDDLFGLVYDLDGGPLGDGLALAVEGIGADSGTFSYLAGPGPADECGIGVDCGFVTDLMGTSVSQEFVFVSPKDIPEPTTLAIFALAIAGLGFSRQKKST